MQKLRIKDKVTASGWVQSTLGIQS